MKPHLRSSLLRHLLPQVIPGNPEAPAELTIRDLSRMDHLHDHAARDPHERRSLHNRRIRRLDLLAFLRPLAAPSLRHLCFLFFYVNFVHSVIF